MDDLDRAAEREAISRAEAIARAVQREPGPGPVLHGGRLCCCDCLEPIPRARLRAMPGCGRCVACQAEAETTAGGAL